MSRFHEGLPCLPLIASVIVLHGCSGQPDTQTHARLASSDVVVSALCKQLSAEPVCYRWQETLGDDEIDHHGYVLFLLDGDKVYSRAWFERAEFVREWPAVEGVGTLKGNTIKLVYRSASGLPEHDFYFARCNFKMSNDGQSFHCEFTQKAEPNSNDLATGQAIGKLQPDAKFEAHEERIRQNQGR